MELAPGPSDRSVTPPLPRHPTPSSTGKDDLERDICHGEHPSIVLEKVEKKKKASTHQLT